MSKTAPLPHDLDAEAATISAAFLSPAAFYEAQAILREGGADFYSDANRWIWRAAEDIEGEGGVVDIVTVAARLRAWEKLDVVGGTPYLAQILEATPAVANIAEHATIVAGLAHRRNLIHTLKTLAAEGYGDVGDPFEWGQHVEQRIYEVTPRTSGAEHNGTMAVMVPKVLEELEARRKGELGPPGTPTGFRELDRRLNGLKNAKVYIIAGLPSMGKSALQGQIGTHVASLGRLVVEISTEQKPEELTNRKLAQLATVSYKAIESSTASHDDMGRLYVAAEKLRKLPLLMENLPRPTIGQLRSTIRRGVARLRKLHGPLPLGLISIDQMQHLDGEGRRGVSRESEVADLSRKIAWMAGEFDCPILLACQLNRESAKRPDKRPTMSDLRDSGAVEADAFGILFPFREAYFHKAERGQETADAPHACEVIIAKNKNGPGGSVELSFHGPSMAFEEPEERRQTSMYDHDEGPL